MARVDRDLTHRKFDEAVSQLSAQREVLEARGLFVLGMPKYPAIEILFVPRQTLRIAVPITQSGSILLPPGSAAMGAAEFHNLSARAFKGRFELDDYDLRPPSLQFIDAWTNAPLDYNTMFRALEYEKERKAHLVLLGDHPVTGRPFLCLRGIREYHEHPQHSGDDWLLYRNDMSFFSIVMAAWRACIDLPRPVLIPQPQGFQVQWQADEKI